MELSVISGAQAPHLGHGRPIRQPTKNRVGGFVADARRSVLGEFWNRPLSGWCGCNQCQTAAKRLDKWHRADVVASSPSRGCLQALKHSSDKRGCLVTQESSKKRATSLTARTSQDIALQATRLGTPKNIPCLRIKWGLLLIAEHQKQGHIKSLGKL